MHPSSKTVSMILLILMLSTAVAPSVPLALAEEVAPAEATTEFSVEISTEVAPEESVAPSAPIAPSNPEAVTESGPSETESMTSEEFSSTNSAVSEEEGTTAPTEQQAPRLHPEIDEFTGALTYSYDLVTPPGRNGIQPNLALTYNSGNEAKDSIVGYGWSLNIPSIERINRNGTDQLYSDNTYSSSLSGELIAIDSSTYAAKSEKGDFLTYEISGDSWLVTDKSGTVYTFGSSADERQDDPSDSTRIYKWMLSEVRDTNDNFIRYEYEKENGQIYPSLITYTGNGSTDGIFTVEFTHVESAEDTPDSSRSFQVNTSSLIDTISINISGSESIQYTLDYTHGNNSRRSLLSGITEVATDASGSSTTIPQTTFDYQNSSKAWELEADWEIPTYIGSYGYEYGYDVMGADAEALLQDINGDGLVDMAVLVGSNIESDAETRTWEKVFLNTGTGWELEADWEIPTYVSGSDEYGYDVMGADAEALLQDINGDGLVDMAVLVGTNIEDDAETRTWDKVFQSQGLPSDRLSTISLSSGAMIDVSYEQVPILDRNPYGQTQTFYAVSEITKDDGLGNTSTSTYEYADGKYYFHEEHYRSFTGFGSVSVTDDEGNTRIVYNHQGNDSDTDNGEFEDVFSKVGLPYRIEEYDASGNLYRVTIQKWDEAELETGRAFAKLIRKTVLNYDGDLDHKDTVTEYVYDDTTGNQTGEVHYGEVTATDDGSYTDVINTDEKFTTIYVYATDASGIVLNKLSAVRLEDASGTVIAEERYLYDSLPGGEVSLGNKTGKTTWQNMPSSWYVESYTVDAYGLTTSFTDARGKTTTIDYDSNNLYPETTTNARGQVTTTEYELRNGQVKSTTNPNGFTSETEFDGFGRPISISVPDPITGTTTELTSFDYDDTSFPSSVTSTTTVSGVSIESRQYFDGFKRLIQEWKPSEDSTATWVDYFYDSRGNVASTTLPYTGTATTWTGLSSSAASVDTLYDVLGRPTSVSTPSGTSTYVYDEWSVVATDAEGHTKSQTFNANGNLIQVDEHNGSAIYTTNYNYDELSNLTLLTDAQGNVRSFVYDSLGRQRIQEDLHSPTATGFRAWRSQYDANGNRTRITDPMGQVINYFYDDLNRLIKEDWNNDGTFDVVYNHDGGTNGIGYVSRIISDGLVVNFVHDKAGNTNLEVKQMGATSYVTQTVYDLMGRQASVTYPGAFYTVSTTYNSAGQIETVSKDSSLVVSDMDYDVSGQISSITYANGTVTTNTYDPAEDNRLTHKVTTGSYDDGTTITTGNIQDLTYAYDDIGNITSIVDASITSTAKTSTYTYDDLSRLLSVTTSGLASGDYTESYTYDAVGNLTYKSDVGTLTYAGTGGTGSPNPHAVTSVAGVAYTYDDNGNLTSDGTHSYTWNIKNQMTTTGSWTYYYDAQGTRFKSVKSAPAETQIYVNPYLEFRSGVPTSYLYAGSLRVASFESSQLSTYHQDHLGGTALVTDSTGTTIQIYDYAPFGEEKINTTTSTLDAAYSFTGKEYEEDTGLYYFEARWYNPTIGRFVSEDPAQMDQRLTQKLIYDPQSLNFYAYAGNNPVRNTDPTGELTTYGALLMGIMPGLAQAYGAGWALSYALESSNPITSSYLQHSLSYNPEDVFINENNQNEWGNLIDNVKNSDSFTGKISELVNQAEASGTDEISYSTIDDGGGYRLDSSTDLAMSIGTATMGVVGNKSEDGSWNFTVNIQDTYHFDSNFSYDDGGAFDQANNVAALAQSTGLISKFDENINFSYTYEND